MFEETDGNAFFVEEVYQHLLEEGRLFDADGKWKTALRGEPIQVPESVRLVITRRRPAAQRDGAQGADGRRRHRPRVSARPSHRGGGPGGRAVIDAIEESERAHLVTAEGGRSTDISSATSWFDRRWSAGCRCRAGSACTCAWPMCSSGCCATAIEAHAAALAHHLYQAGGCG